MSEPVAFEYDGVHALPLPRGGQLWHAPWPLCWTIYLVSGDGGFLAITDPREQGSMTWNAAGMNGGFQPLEWWQDYFAAHGYTCEGQLRDVEMTKWNDLLADVRGEAVSRGAPTPAMIAAALPTDEGLVQILVQAANDFGEAALRAEYGKAPAPNVERVQRASQKVLDRFRALRATLTAQGEKP